MARLKCTKCGSTDIKKIWRKAPQVQRLRGDVPSVKKQNQKVQGCRRTVDSGPEHFTQNTETDRNRLHSQMEAGAGLRWPYTFSA